MTLVVRDEADIIETNIDYHLAQGVDFVIATDHGSTDGTTQRLRRYERDGVLRLIYDERVGHHQSRHSTHMARLATEEHGADWILHNDADEFWWPLAGTLHDVFASIPDAYGQLQVRRRVNFLPSDGADRPFHERLIHRDATSRNLIGDALEPKVAHRGHPGVVIAPGNHSLSGAELVAAPAADMIEIFHFPMRSYAQFQRKVLKLGSGYEQAGPLSPEVGRDQLHLLDLYRRGALPAYWADSLLDAEALRRRIDEGTVIADRRLQRFLAEMAEGEPPAGHAGGAAIQSLVGCALRAEASRGAAENVAAQATGEAQLLRERLAVAERELAAVTATLHEIRTSRLMRWTARLRRLWYRLSGALRALAGAARDC